MTVNSSSFLFYAIIMVEGKAIVHLLYCECL